MRWYFILILFFLSSGVLNAETTLCYFSLNNEKEYEVMEKLVTRLDKVSKEKIIIKEFQTKDDDPHNSFKQMLDSKTICNGLVISGHHTGSFGGERSQGKLDIDFIEEMSCQPQYADWFDNIRAVWLQGCRTMGVKIEENEVDASEYSADFNMDRVAAMLAQDYLEQSPEELNNEFSATLDQDNPLSSRYLRVFSNSTVFGWTKTAPGKEARSELSLPYHLAHTIRLTDDRKEYFTDPAKNLTDEQATKYAVTLLGLLNRNTPSCYSCPISEETSVNAWLNHGQAHGAVPLSFQNPDLMAFSSLASSGNVLLHRAKELDCLLKQDLSEEQKLAILDEILQDERLLGYNFNAIWSLLQEQKKKGNFAFLDKLQKKLSESIILKHFLMRKLSSKELGILRKIDYYAFYRDMTNQREKDIEDIILSASLKMLIQKVKEDDYGRRDFQQTLFDSLIKNDLVGDKGEFLNMLVNSTESQFVLQKVAKAVGNLELETSKVGEMLQLIIEKANGNIYVFGEVTYVIGNSKFEIPKAGEMLQFMIDRANGESIVLGSVAGAIGNSKFEIPKAGEMLQLVIDQANGNAYVIDNVVYAIGYSKFEIPKAGENLQSIIDKAKGNTNVLESVASAIRNSKFEIPKAGEILRLIIDKVNGDAIVLGNVAYAIGYSKFEIPKVGEMFQLMIDKANGDVIVLGSVAGAIRHSEFKISKAGGILQSIIDMAKGDAYVLEEVVIAIKNPKLKISSHDKMLLLCLENSKGDLQVLAQSINTINAINTPTPESNQKILSILKNLKIDKYNRAVFKKIKSNLINANMYNSIMDHPKTPKEFKELFKGLPE